MENVKQVATKLGVYPKLRLGIKKPAGGVELTGPHIVKFIEEPKLVNGLGDDGKPRQELKFIVEENGEKYRWQFPILNKQGQPNYLIERTMNIKVGEEMVLEMVKSRGTNYIDVRKVDEAPEEPEQPEEELHDSDKTSE